MIGGVVKLTVFVSLLCLQALAYQLNSPAPVHSSRWIQGSAYQRASNFHRSCKKFASSTLTASRLPQQPVFQLDRPLVDFGPVISKKLLLKSSLIVSCVSTAVMLQQSDFKFQKVLPQMNSLLGSCVDGACAVAGSIKNLCMRTWKRVAGIEDEIIQLQDLDLSVWNPMVFESVNFIGSDTFICKIRNHGSFKLDLGQQMTMSFKDATGNIWQRPMYPLQSHCEGGLITLLAKSDVSVGTRASSAGVPDSDAFNALASLRAGDEVSLRAGNSMITPLSREYVASQFSSGWNANPIQEIHSFVSGLGIAPAMQVLDDVTKSSSSSPIKLKLYWDSNNVVDISDDSAYKFVCDQLGSQLSQSLLTNPASTTFPKFTKNQLAIVAGPQQFISQVKASLHFSSFPSGNIVCIAMPN